MPLSRNYWQILEKIGGAKMSAHVCGVGLEANPDLSKPIIDFLKENNKRFKEQEKNKPLEGPEYE